MRLRVKAEVIAGRGGAGVEQLVNNKGGGLGGRLGVSTLLTH